ncbi:cytochrome P450 [Aspergillus karnatakaensis]|uniref:cytochrome P450 n=1 Tax=Aspergillus karnatakaensis TaxID=1810916 RepID=UPI003CCE4149
MAAIETQVAEGCPFSNPRNLFTDLEEHRSSDNIEYSEIFGAHVVSRYDDIVYVLDHPEIFASKGVTVPEFPDVIKPLFADRVPQGGTLLGWDNPDHDRLRASVSGFFVPRKLERFRPLMTELAHELINGFVEKGEIELKSNFALPLPLKMIVTVAGLDPAKWRWIGRCLSLFGGITEAEYVSAEQEVQDVLDLHDYVAEVIQNRKHDRQDDLISYIWDQRDSGAVEMTDFEHLAMISGLLLAGHETTTSVLSMGTSHLLHEGVWKQATSDEASVSATIEELLRYESAITGMLRLVKEDTTLGPRALHAGDRVFLAYNSGSRDNSAFECPDRLQLGRKFSKQHLGFGRGVHACLGAPLARLLLKTELAVLRERLPNLRLVTPYTEIEYANVGPSRGIERVVVAWDPPKSPWTKDIFGGYPSSHKTKSLDTISATVTRLAFLTEEILELTLIPGPLSSLPVWEPGAHISILSEHGYRQYSLCSDPQDTSHWKIAILKDELGTGGSRWFHQTLREGSNLTVRALRNHFRLHQSQRYIFIAGGIGITPIIPMLAEAKRQHADYKLIYLGRSRATMAYLHELQQEHPVEVWTKADGERFDLESFALQQNERTQVYCCGPERLLSALEKACIDKPMIQLKVERFQAAPTQELLPRKSFEVILNRSGRTLAVPPEQTLLEVLNQNGCGIMSTCSKGTCGTCEVEILEGIAEHRDTVLSSDEKIENRTMMPCVSRCIGERLVLDLW